MRLRNLAPAVEETFSADSHIPIEFEYVRSLLKLLSYCCYRESLMNTGKVLYVELFGSSYIEILIQTLV